MSEEFEAYLDIDKFEEYLFNQLVAYGYVPDRLTVEDITTILETFLIEEGMEVVEEEED